MWLRQPFFDSVDNRLIVRKAAIAIHRVDKITIDNDIKGAIMPKRRGHLALGADLVFALVFDFEFDFVPVLPLPAGFVAS